MQNKDETDLILHICPENDWLAAQKTGEYRALSLEQEGFIHCSRPEQILATANRYYQGVQGLLILWIDPQRVKAQVRWEDSHGESFPHIYGPLNTDAVPRFQAFPPDPDGVFRHFLASAPTKQPVLHTARLILRPFSRSDAAEVQRMAGAYEVASTALNIPFPYPDGTAEAWIASQGPEFETGKGITLAVTLRESGMLVGAIGIMVAQNHRNAEIGYWIGREHWGKGYATEAGKAVLGYGFEELDLHRIFARHFRRNPASGKVMQKLGMVHEGTLRDHVYHWGQFEDLECYGLLRQDWKGAL